MNLNTLFTSEPQSARSGAMLRGALFVIVLLVLAVWLS